MTDMTKPHDEGFGRRYVHTGDSEKLHFLNPQPNEISLAEIARGLSRTFRWRGIGSRVFSVADHSVAAANLLCYGNAIHSGYPWASPLLNDEERAAFRSLLNYTKLRVLFHDAHEAFTGDVPSPIKGFLVDGAKSADCSVKAVEKALDGAIFDKYMAPYRGENFHKTFRPLYKYFPNNKGEHAFVEEGIAAVVRYCDIVSAAFEASQLNTCTPWDKWEWVHELKSMDIPEMFARFVLRLPNCGYVDKKFEKVTTAQDFFPEGVIKVNFFERQDVYSMNRSITAAYRGVCAWPGTNVLNQNGEKISLDTYVQKCYSVFVDEVNNLI